MGALAVILNPALDIPAWIPVAGQLDALALTMLAVRTFNAQVPAELRREIEVEIREGRSRFDRDLGRGALSARHLASRLPLPGAARGRLGSGDRGHAGAPAPWYRSPAEAGEQPQAGAGGVAGSGGPAREEQRI